MFFQKKRGTATAVVVVVIKLQYGKYQKETVKARLKKRLKIKEQRPRDEGDEIQSDLEP